MTPLMSFLIVAVVSALAGCLVGHLYGNLRRCNACYRVGRLAGLGEADKRVEELEAQLAYCRKNLDEREERIKSGKKANEQQSKQISDMAVEAAG